jgi:hypothetical protein
MVGPGRREWKKKSTIFCEGIQEGIDLKIERWKIVTEIIEGRGVAI